MVKRNKGETNASVKLEPKQVCILGTAETMKDAPFDDPSWEMWSIAPVIGTPGLKRVDRLLELHDRDSWGPRVAEINESKIPVWMRKHYEEIPLSEEFPIERILGKFRRYFTNSISYLIAHAILEGYTDIALFGVHMANQTEYAKQRPSCEYFLGYAEALGINIWIPEEADMLKAARLYGYEAGSVITTKLNHLLQDMSGKQAEYRRLENVNHDAVQQTVGWINALTHVKQIAEQ